MQISAIENEKLRDEAGLPVIGILVTAKCLTGNE